MLTVSVAAITILERIISVPEVPTLPSMIIPLSRSVKRNLVVVPPVALVSSAIAAAVAMPADEDPNDVTDMFKVATSTSPEVLSTKRGVELVEPRSNWSTTPSTIELRTATG